MAVQINHNTTLQPYNYMTILLYNYMTIRSSQSRPNCKVLRAGSESFNILLLDIHPSKYLHLKKSFTEIRTRPGDLVMPDPFG